MGPALPTEVEKDTPLCLNECAVFTQAYTDTYPNIPFVFYYNFSSNTVVPVWSLPIFGTNQITDIANTTNKLWILTNENVGVLREYDMTLCPFSLTLNRTFTNPGNPNPFPYNGLAAINNNTLISQSTISNPQSQFGIVKYDISTNNIVQTTILGYMPAGRFLAGDLIYVPSTLTGPKVIFLSVIPNLGLNPPNFISQIDVTTGVLEMDKLIPSNLITSPWGLFTRNNKLYIQDANTSSVWGIGLNYPYPLSFINQINSIGYTNFGGGASNEPKCNTVSFKKPKPYISIPGTSAIDPIISCTEWKDPENRTEIYLNPSGITVVGTTKLYNDPDFTDPIPSGYWVSDGQQVYLIGEDGLIENTTYCT